MISSISNLQKVCITLQIYIGYGITLNKNQFLETHNSEYGDGL